jgi:hypothetical protein
MLVAAMGLGAVGAYVQLSKPASSLPKEFTRDDQGLSGKSLVRPNDEQSSATVLRVVPKDTEVEFDQSRLDVPAGVNPMAHAVSETLRAFKLNQVRALDVELKDGKATVFFNPAVNNMGLGSTEEGMLVKALRMALGQFQEVKSIEFSLEGQPIGSFGHNEFTYPLDPLR